MDPALELYRKDLVVESGRKLDKARMIRFDERTGYFASTDLGRTASHFYIKYNTIEVNALRRPTRSLGSLQRSMEPCITHCHRLCIM